MMWVVSLAVSRNAEWQRGEHKLWGISHGLSQLGGTAACLVPKGDLTGDGFRKEHGHYVIAAPRRRLQTLSSPETGPDKSTHKRS